MASNSTVARYRPAIAVLAALAAGYTIYYIHNSSHFSTEPSASSRRLWRSNAVVHRRNRRQDDGPRDPADWPRSAYDAPRLLQEFRACPNPLATFRFNIGTNDQGSVQFFEVPLSPVAFPSLELIKQECGVSDEGAEDIRQNYETALMKAFLCQRLPPNCSLVDPGGPVAFVDAFEAEDFIFTDSILLPIAQFNDGAYEYLDERREAYESRSVRPPVRRRLRSRQEAAAQGPDTTVVQQTPPSPSQPLEINSAETTQIFEPEDFALPSEVMEVDEESEQSWNGDENEESRREGQSLLDLLYHIAEDQARREGVVHRGVSCNSCNATPIHGIRYRCTNCVDYDLCEQCEAMQFHMRNHIFVKIRIPAPSHSSTRPPQPVWYPGTAQSLPNSLPRDLNKSLTEETGFSDNEVDAMWDQFKNLAASLWQEDPDKLGYAIDREAFDKCFVVSARATKMPPTSLIFDRMFSFYDTNHDSLIGFREFVAGLAAARSKDPDERHKRIFFGFDYDGDGYVSRRDLLVIFKAHYTVQREFTRELVTEMEADLLEGGTLRDNISSNQPISAAYHGSFSTLGGRAGEGKQRDAHGDMVIVDDGGAIAEDPTDEGDLDQIIGDLREIAKFGSLQDEDMATVQPDIPPSAPEGGNQVDHGGVITDARPTEITSSEATERASTPETLVSTPISEWPPSHVADRDVEGALGHSVALGEVTNESDRNKILKAAANRIKAEEERPRRQQVRDSAVRDRHNRRQFYLDDENKVLDSQVIQRQVSQSATGSGAAQAAQGLGLSGQSHEPTVDVGRPPPKNDKSAKEPAKVSSPALQAFREPPPLPVNVGQEILYQITQESINEMLDPMFRLREDLAMEIIELAPHFESWKHHLAAYKQTKVIELCKLQIERIQSLWRRSAEDFTLGSSIRFFLQKYIAHQSDIDREEYSSNLLDMFHVGIIDRETLEKKLEEKRQHDEAHAEAAKKADRETTVKPSLGQDSAEQSSSAPHAAEPSSQAQQEYPPAAVELHESVRAFNEADLTIEAAIRDQELPSLLSSAGYSVAEEASAQSSASASAPPPDPTLPQNRPNASTPSSPNATTTRNTSNPLPTHQPPAPQLPNPLFHLLPNLSVPATEAARLLAKASKRPNPDFPNVPGHPFFSLPPNDQSKWNENFRCFMKYLTMMDVVAREDEARDGPGRLSRSEYEEVVKGPKGAGLGWLGGWVDFHAL